VSLVLGRNDLRPCGILLEELDEFVWLVEGGERPKDRGNIPAAIDTSESLFDTTKPITGEVPEGEIDPSALVEHVNEVDHSKDGLLAGHVAEVLCNCIILLPSEPGFLEIVLR
jgi:hypothetical protein